jgi:hypothetical protein
VTGVLTHTVPADTDTDSTGRLYVVTPTVTVEIHPAAFVPPNVYTLLALGVKAAVWLTTLPFQVYVVAPEAVKVAVASGHTEADTGDVVSIGTVLVVIPSVNVETHPAELRPVSV